MRRVLLAVGVLGLAVMAGVLPAYAGPLTISPPANVSIPSPFPPGCGGATEGSVPGANFVYPNSETEP